MNLHPAQQTIVKSKARFKVAICGRGFGKSLLAEEWMLYHAVHSKSGKVLYIANTQRQAREIIWGRLKNRVSDIGDVDINNSLLEIQVPNVHGGKTLLILKGYENVEDLRGNEFDAIVLDEIATMRNFWTGFNDVLMPTLRMSKGPVLMIGSPRGFNHAYDLFNEAGKHEDWESFQFTSYDNPHLPVDEIEKMKVQLPIDSFEQEYMANFKKREGLIYPEFNRAVHCFDDPYEIDIAETIAGVDFGYTDPMAVTHIHKDRRGTYWIFDEYYKTGKTDAQIAEYVAAQNFEKVYPDPASPGAVQELQDRHVNVYEVKKGPNSIEAGIQKVRELLKQRRIRVHKSCINVLNEFEQYAYKETGDKPDPDTPDHLLDSLRYVIMMNTSTNQMKNTWVPLAERNTNNRKGRI